MKSLTTILSLLVFPTLMLLGGCKNRLNKEPRHGDGRGRNAGEAAKKTISELPTLIDTGSFDMLGFHSWAETKRAKLGTPIPILSLRCDLFAKENAERMGGPEAFAFSKDTLFPVLVGDSVRLAFRADSLTDSASRAGSKAWIVAEIGNAELMLLVDSTLKAHSRESKLPASVYSVIEIPNLNQLHLFYSAAGTGMLIPLNGNIPHPCPVGPANNAITFASALRTFYACKEIAQFCPEVKL
ncbi:MAG: hypothetical protein ABI036_07110 [Fibrobacteria bacterium]